jgi:hypothetical protein
MRRGRTIEIRPSDGNVGSSGMKAKVGEWIKCRVNAQPEHRGMITEVQAAIHRPSDE